MFSISFEKHLVTLIIKMQILFARPSLRQQRAISVSPLSYTNTIFNQSARVLI